MDTLLFVIAVLAVGIAAAAVLLPSELGRRRRRAWSDDENLRDQLAAWR